MNAFLCSQVENVYLVIDFLKTVPIRSFQIIQIPGVLNQFFRNGSGYGTHRYCWFCTWWCTEAAPVTLRMGQLCLMKGHTSPWGGQTGGEASRAPARSTWGICVITHPSSRQPGKQAAEKGHGDCRHAWLRNDDGRFTNIHIRP